MPACLGKKDKSASARQAGDSNGSDEEDETFASRAARRKGQLQKGSSRTAPKSRSSSPAQSDSSRGHAKDSGSHDSDADEESPAPAMLKSRKGQHKSAEIGIHTSRESSVALRSNSEISAGWTVRCKCGITDDDGAAMTECEGGCKTWVHIACFALEGDAAYWCDACKENVHTSKPTSTKPTANASSSNADSGESQSTPCAVGSLAGAANMDSKASDAAATAAAVATSKSPISSADDSNSTGSADGGKPAFAREDSRAVAAGLPLASAKLDESDEGIHLTAGSPPKSAALPRSDTGKVILHERIWIVRLP